MHTAAATAVNPLRRIPEVGRVFKAAMQARESAAAQGAVLAVTTALGRGAIILGMPLLTRLYSPADFGVLAIFAALVSIGTVVVCWRYDAAIALSATDSEAANLAALCWLLLVAHCGLLLLVVSLVGAQIAHWMGDAGLASCLWVLPAAIFASGTMGILSAWATQRKSLGGVAAGSTVQSLGTIILQAVVGVFSPGAWGLMVADFAGRGSAAALLVWLNPWQRGSLRLVSARKIKLVACRNYRYPTLLLWASLLNTASAYVPIAFLALAFEDAVVGLFALSMRVASLPVLLLGKAVGQVFLSRARQSVESGVIASRTRTLLRILSQIAFPYAALLIVAGDDLFAFAFGENWREAGSYTSILVPSLLVVFLASPISTLALVHQEERSELLFQVVLIAARVSALCTCFICPSPMVVVAAFSLAGGACWSVRLCWLVRLSGNHVQDCLRDIAPVFLFSVIIMALLLLIKSACIGGGIVVLAGFIMAALAGWPLLRSVVPLLRSSEPASQAV